MRSRRTVYDGAWPAVLSDLGRLGATAGEVRRIGEMVEVGLYEVAFSLVEAVLARLRSELMKQGTC